MVLKIFEIFNSEMYIARCMFLRQICIQKQKFLLLDRSSVFNKKISLNIFWNKNNSLEVMVIQQYRHVNQHSCTNQNIPILNIKFCKKKILFALAFSA